VPKEKPPKGGRNKQANGSGTGGSGQFHIPRSIEVELQTSPVLERDVIHLRYFTEYQWLLDFSVYTGIVYVVSEVGVRCNEWMNVGS